MNIAEGPLPGGGEGAEADRRSLPGLAGGNCNGGFMEKAQARHDSEVDVETSRETKGGESTPRRHNQCVQPRLSGRGLILGLSASPLSVWLLLPAVGACKASYPSSQADANMLVCSGLSC